MAMRRKTSTATSPMFKFIMIGDSGTGKSSLLIRYTKNSFAEEYNVTIGIQFATKKIQIDDNYSVRLQIWDTAGQEAFKSIVKNFYRNSHAVMLVYDITRRKTFQSLKSWIEEARENITMKSAIYVLLGTHLDKEQKRQVSRKQAEEWMQKEDIAFYFETSSKTDLNVSKAFEEVAKQIFISALEKGRVSSQSERETSNEKTHLEVQKQKPKANNCC